jgi:hypothetical protein
MNLLTRGNDKIGNRIYAFNIPARTTCPGMSAACVSCYAARGRWLFPAVREALDWNLRTARRRHFVEDMVEELRRRRVRLLRLHSSGDFFDATYTGRWAEVLDRSPNVTAYAYTRSWRVGFIRPALEELATLPNMRLWYSADADTGKPSPVPAGVRVAWLLQQADEPVPAGVDLVFRVHVLRREPQRRVGLTMICPTEQGRESTATCSTCGVCWRGAGAR